jgi:hypothetical protein
MSAPFRRCPLFVLEHGVDKVRARGRVPRHELDGVRCAAMVRAPLLYTAPKSYGCRRAILTCPLRRPRQISSGRQLISRGSALVLLKRGPR